MNGDWGISALLIPFTTTAFHSSSSDGKLGVLSARVTKLSLDSKPKQKGINQSFINLCWKLPVTTETTSWKFLASEFPPKDKVGFF